MALRVKASDPESTMNISEDTLKKNMSGDSQLIARGLSRTNPITVNDSISLNDQAKLLIGDIGYIPSGETKDFSLLTTCGDGETLDNENILDLSSYENTTAETISATDKFSTGSAFYNLDEDIPTTYAENNAAIAAITEGDYVSFATVIYDTYSLMENTTFTTSTTTTTY
jgi:hypothetical protein